MVGIERRDRVLCRWSFRSHSQCRRYRSMDGDEGGCFCETGARCVCSSLGMAHTDIAGTYCGVCLCVDSGQGRISETLSIDAHRLNYCERLAEGRVIGSGLIEGACKNLLGRRLKQPGACWRVDRANRIACVCGVLYSRQWEYAWKKNN